MTSLFLPLLAALFAWVALPQEGRPTLVPAPEAPVAAAGQGRLPDSLRTLVLEAYRTGRYWHGVRALREGLAGEKEYTEEDLLLLAQGEAGWGNWEGVWELLEGPLAPGSTKRVELRALLGRAREEAEDWSGAADAYASALEGGEGGTLERDEIQAMRLRLGRALGRGGMLTEAHGLLQELLKEELQGTEWMALELARVAAEKGAPEETRILLSAVPDLQIRNRGWDLPARALLVRGDSVGAEAAYWSAIPTLSTGGDRIRAWERVGTIRLARGDSLGARGAFHQVLLEGGGGSGAVTAARGLLALGFDSVKVARRSAELLAGAGRDQDALKAWGRYEELLGGSLPPEVSLALARIHLRLQDPSKALSRLAELLGATQADIGVPALVLQAQALRLLERGGEARAAQDSLMARFPHRAEAVEILFLRADALQGQGELAGALRAYEATAALAPTQNRAGEARMRMGRIHLAQEREEAAVDVFQGYLADFPEGRRWDEAAFWAGRTLLSLGREEEGRELLGRLRERFALSFYTILAGRALELPYEPGISRRGEPLPLSPDMARGLALLDALRRAGLDEGAAWAVDELRARGRALEDLEDRKAFLLRLGLELNDRGLTREGINLGWEVQRLGEGWSRELMTAIYPFPYREMVIQEARERGLDPFLMAGLMRQESAFWREALSRADARGLMQILPGTGSDLARSQGPGGFDADLHLYRPEVNLHLGMAFFSDLRRRFGEDLSIILSAYNAGPTRALRWRQYPEAGDLPSFVERIPFPETRGYVKNVLLNREIYAWLYGQRESQNGQPGGS